MSVNVESPQVVYLSEPSRFSVKDIRYESLYVIIIYWKHRVSQVRLSSTLQFISTPQYNMILPPDKSE